MRLARLSATATLLMTSTTIPTKRFIRVIASVYHLSSHLGGSENLDEIPCRIIVLTPVSLCLRLCLRCLTQLTCLYMFDHVAYTVHLEQEGLTRTLRGATPVAPVLHIMQLTPQRELTRCMLCTMDIYYT